MFEKNPKSLLLAAIVCFFICCFTIGCNSGMDNATADKIKSLEDKIAEVRLQALLLMTDRLQRPLLRH